MATPASDFVLICIKPWVFLDDPGRHRVINPENNADGQADEMVQWQANKSNYEGQENVRRAINAALNVAVPPAYRRVGGRGMGAREYAPTTDPREIIATLRRLYGQLGPAETRTLQTK